MHNIRVLNQRPREAGTSTILSVYLLVPQTTAQQLIGELLHNKSNVTLQYRRNSQALNLKTIECNILCPCSLVRYLVHIQPIGFKL